MTDQTKAPELTALINALRNGYQADMDGTFVKVSRQACEEAADLLEGRANLAAEQVREAYERGLDDAAKAMFSATNASVEVFDTEDETDAVDYQLQEGLRILRALKSNDTNGGHQ